MPSTTSKFIDRQTATLREWLPIFSFTHTEHLWLLLPGILLTIMSSALAPVVAVLMGKFGDAVTQFGGGIIDSAELKERTKVPVYGLTIVGCLSLFLSSSMFATWAMFGELQAKRVRQELFRSLLDKELDWFEARETGIAPLLTRLQTQIRELQLGTSQPLGFAIHGLLEGCMAFGLSLYYSWKLTLVVLSGLPIVGLLVRLSSRGLQRHIHSQNTSLSEASRTANNAIVNISLIKCFNTQSLEVSRYVSAISLAARFALKQARLSALQTGSLSFSLMTMFLLGFWYGGKLVHDGQSTAGKVITAIWTAFMAVNAFQSIIPQILVLAKGHAAAIALRNLLGTVECGRRIKKRIDRFSPNFCEGLIEMQQVSFAYPSRPDHLVVVPSTLMFRGGSMTFLIGKSGSGKSTLGNLLMNFYTNWSGLIAIDGHDIRDVDTNWLRNNITLVQQETFLFNETIHRNIALGHRHHEGVTSNQVWDCIELAALENAIKEMPHGIDTKLGVGGKSLSGGQTQRVALARARLRNTPILVLDESTSALDGANRTVVMERIRSWRAGMTTIIITHDTSQIEDGDYVYVLDEGKIIDQGLGIDLKQYRQQGRRTSSPTADADASQPTVNPKLTYQQGGARRPSALRWKKDASIRRASFELKVDDLVSGRYLNLSETVHRSSRLTTFLGADSLSARTPLRTLNLTRCNVNNLNGVDVCTTSLPVLASDLDATSQDVPLDKLQSHTRQATRISYPDTGRADPLPSPRLFEQNRSKKCPGLGSTAFHQLEIDEEAQQISLQIILGTLWSTLTIVHRMWLIVSSIAILCRSAIPAIFSHSVAQIFETYYMTNGYESKALKWCMVLLAIAVIEGCLSYISSFLLDVVARTWVDKLRATAIQRIVSQPKAWFEFEENSAAFLTSVLDRNAEEMRTLVSRYAAKTLSIIIMVIVSGIWSFVLCWKLTLVGMAATPIVVGLLKAMDTTSRKWEVRIDVAADAIGAVFAETFTDIRTVRSLTLEGYFHRKYEQATSVAFAVGRTRTIYVGALFGLSESTIHFLMAVLMWYSTQLATSYEVGATQIFTSLSLLFITCTQAGTVSSLVSMVALATESASRVIRLTRLKKGGVLSLNGYTSTQGALLEHVASTAPAIQFANISFSYPTRPNAQILTNLNLDIATGRCTAIVGRSGCGKSTLAALAVGLYPIQSDGEQEPPSVSILGCGLSTLPPSQLSTLVTIVPQHPVILPATTVWDNITYGLEPQTRLTSRANVELAAQQAAIHDFIISLPQQYDTVIGEGGLGVSGGEAQRIVIARALARRPQVLLLDEAMAALDAESASQIRHTLSKVMKGENGERVTVVVITHAADMMRFADTVVMLEAGRVVEEGGFQELMRRKGKFAKMLSHEVC